MSQIDIKISEQETNTKYQIIKFTGQLDESNVDKSAEPIYKLIETMKEGDGLILDVSELEYLNSKAIGDIFDWHSKVSEKGGKIVVAAPPENIEDILTVVGINQVMEIKKTLADAKKLF